MPSDLSDRVAVVTGGSSGIGRAIAKKMMAAGATVVIGDIVEPSNHDIPWLEVDVTIEDSVVGFVQRVADRHGRLDILVNNAGIMFEQDLENHRLDDWERAMAVNLRGPFLMSKHASPLLASGGGSIVNIGSIEGYSCNPGHVAYAASKAGVHGLTVALAVDLGPRGIRANAIAPGWIDTDLNAAFVDRHPDRAEVAAELAKLHPIGHIGQPDDVADVAVWLAGDESRFVSGQVITVDGARLARPPLPPSLDR